MIEPEFTVLTASARRFAAVPTLDFDVNVSEPSGRAVYTIALTAGITIRSLAWTQISLLVPAFTGATTFRIPVPCSYALEQSAPACLHAAAGDVPLVFHFNGTVFYRGDAGDLQLELVPWSCSVDFAFPVAVWHELMETHHPHGAVVTLHTDTVDALLGEQRRRGLPSLDACVEALLEEARCSNGS